MVSLPGNEAARVIDCRSTSLPSASAFCLVTSELKKWRSRLSKDKIAEFRLKLSEKMQGYSNIARWTFLLFRDYLYEKYIFIS